MQSFMYRFRVAPNGIDRFDEVMRIGQLPLGWPLLGDLTGKSSDELKQLISNYPGTNYSNRRIGMITGYFMRLLSLKVGDYVLVSGPNRSIVVCLVTETYHFEPGFSDKHMAHQVGIEKIKTIDSNDLSKPLKHTLDAANTVILIKDPDQKEEVSNIIQFNLEDSNLIETNIRKFKFSDGLKNIELEITASVDKKDLLAVINKINFN